MVRKLSVAVVLLAMLSILLGYQRLVFAQENPPSQNTAQKPTIEMEESKKMSVSEEGKVSLNFRDADIRTVLRILALKSGVNIVVSPEVVGTITIELKDVPWQQAFDVILLPLRKR